MRQSTDHVFMVQPVRFEFNADAATDNSFQFRDEGTSGDLIQERARQQFLNLVHQLTDAGVVVTLVQDDKHDPAPDAVYPNNWFSTHAEGRLVLYPMRALNRRKERRPRLVEFLTRSYQQVVDLSCFENDGEFLEGTGALVLDRVLRRAYVSLSGRTNPEVLQFWARKLDYEVIDFSSHDGLGHPLYHTNVMMSIGTKYSLVCLEAITNGRDRVERSLADSDREVVEISVEQMRNFCGNILEVQNGEGELFTVMSSRAYAAFKQPQLEILEKFSRVIHTDVSTLESVGGGGARCMITELF